MGWFRFSVSLVFSATLASGASAQSLAGSSPGFHYFYKTGASIEAHSQALVECAVATRGLVNGSDAMTGIAASTGGGLIPALIGGIIDSNENRQGQAANTENCMALKGWSVVGLSEEEGEALESLDNDPAALREALASRVGAVDPAGFLLRGPFANELATGSFKVAEAGDLEEVSLSVRAVRDLIDSAIEAAGKLRPPKPPKLEDGKRPPRAIKTLRDSAYETTDSVSPYVFLRMKSDSRLALNMTSLVLHRLNEDGEEIVYDGLSVTANIGGSQSRKVAKTRDGEVRLYDFVARIPNGLWKIASISNGVYVADLCFGAPAFEIEMGETIYLGEMTLNHDGGYPLDTSNINIAKTGLASVPEIADRARVAEYANGYVSDCFGSYGYAYEMPGGSPANAPDITIEATDADTLSPVEQVDRVIGEIYASPDDE